MGIYPDVLRPIDAYKRIFKKNVYTPVWVSVDTKGEVPNGKYFVGFKFFDENDALLSKVQFEIEILEASLNSIASIYVIPSFIASLFALILNILPYLIHQSDNQTFEIELPEELMNKKSTPTDNLEDKVSRLEDKIKYEKLLIEYEELLHRSKKE